MKSQQTHLANQSQLFTDEISSFDRVNFLTVSSQRRLPIINNFVYAIVTFGYSLMPKIKHFLKIEDIFKYDISQQSLVTIHGRYTCQHQH